MRSIKLYRLTGDRRRLDLAAYFIDERGRQPPHYFTEEAIARGDDPAKFWAETYEYNQSHIPVREQTKVVGHAVRAMYMLARWPISPPSSTTTASSARAKRCGAT